MAIKGNIQLRMTVFVTCAVLLGSSIVLLIMEALIRKDFEELAQNSLINDLTAISYVMKQRMLRVESSTAIVADMASQMYKNERVMDSLLYHCLEEMDSLRAVSLIFDREAVPRDEGYYERSAYYDDDGELKIETCFNGDELDIDREWIKSYDEGERYWGEPHKDYLNGTDVVNFSVPLIDSIGRCIGMAYSVIKESYITSFVTKYKLRKDVDISIYSAEGEVIVAPDSYIMELSPDDLIVREDIIDHIGWKIVLSADRNVIEKDVKRELYQILLFFIVMLVVNALAIKYTVRYVATPFIEKQRKTEKENLLMENEMSLAAEAQRELVPHIFPPFPNYTGIDIYACLHPARKVGGDLYDYFISGNHLYFCIGDISGKGVQGSLFMSATHYLFRSVITAMPMADAAVQMNVALCADNRQCRFVTFWMGCLDLTGGTLQYINAGHDSPLLLRGGKVESFPQSENMPLGVLEEVEFITNSVTLKPGDTLCLYTDGVTEAMDADGNEFGRERLLETVATAPESDVRALLDRVLESVRRHSDGTEQSDDITLLALKFITNETK